MFYKLKDETAFMYLDELERITQGRLTRDQKEERLKFNFLAGETEAADLVKRHGERVKD